MGLRINQNIAALNAHRNLVATDNALSKSLERLSSGFRINRAADDAAGLAISEKLRAQVRGLAQAIRNAQDGISMIQTAEGALNEVHSMLQRMRELALQAANDTLSSEDRAAVNQELQQLRYEIDNLSQRTTFNGKKLLDGTLAVTVSDSSHIKTGARFPGDSDEVTIVSVDVSGAVAGATYTLEARASGNNVTFTLKRDVGQTTISQSVSRNGGLSANEEFDLAFEEMGVTIRVKADTNGVSAANLASALDNKRLVTEGEPINLQVGPAEGDYIHVSFDRVDVDALGLTRALVDFNRSQTVANAQALVTALDGALNAVSETRGKFGAVQNRLEHTVASLGVAQENMSAAESRIRDVDMAQEMVQFTRNQILLQAGTAMLAQANAAPQVVLQLLR